MVKQRNLAVQVLLFVVTFGFYAFYWFFTTAEELKALTRDPEARPILWTLLLCIPLGNLLAWYLYCELYAKVGTEKLNKWILLALAWFFPPAVWFLVQRDLNRWARGGTGPIF